MRTVFNIGSFLLSYAPIAPCVFFALYFAADTDFFLGKDLQMARRLYPAIAVNYLLFPVLIWVLLKSLGFIQKWGYTLLKDRTVFLMSQSVCYFWFYYIASRQSGLLPEPLLELVYAWLCVLCLFIVSRKHFVGSLNGIVAFCSAVVLSTHISVLGGNSVVVLTYMILFCGLVFSAALYWGALTLRDIYGNMIVGLIGCIWAHFWI